jgi:lipoprotein-anchoring transpeptidase ErfK/SrfK
MTDRNHPKETVMKRLFRSLLVLAVLVSAPALLAACGGTSHSPKPTTQPATRPSTSPPPTTTGDRLSVVATAKVASLAVYDSPSGAAAGHHLSNPTVDGTPLVLLVQDSQPGWLHVLLPTRPNGSLGWVHDTDATTSRHDFRIQVQLHSHQLTVYKANQVVVQTLIADGASATPTPVGRFYTTELLKTPNPDGAYGPYAYGLSGHSEVLTSFGAGDGEIGLHGTNESSSIGHDASHGCIRVANAVITQLASMLPVGVPVDVQA